MNSTNPKSTTVPPNIQPGSTLAPGWAETQSTYNAFLTRMTGNTALMDNSTFLKMNQLQLDLNFLDTELIFYPERTGLVGGGSQVMGPPQTSGYSFSRKTLQAIPLISYTTVTKNFLEENLEKGAFLQNLAGYLGEREGREWERVLLYSENASKGAYVTTFPPGTNTY